MTNIEEERAHGSSDRRCEVAKPANHLIDECDRLRIDYLKDRLKHRDFLNRFLVLSAGVVKQLRKDADQRRELIDSLPNSRARITDQQLSFAVMIYIIQPGVSRDLRKTASFLGRVIDGLFAEKPKSREDALRILRIKGLKELAKN